MVISSISEIEILLDEYRNEFNRAASSFYAWKVLSDLPSSDRKVYDALNHNADSWVLIRHSLQTTFIVALGRIFDANPNSLTVHRFLESCKSDIAQFSKGAIEARRIRDNRGQRPDYLDDYLKGVYEATESDFDALINAANGQMAIYKSKYQSIRHKIVAHKDFNTFLSGSDLYSSTNIAEIEVMLEFLYRVECVVHELMSNGEKRALDYFSFDRKMHITENMGNLIRKLPI